MTFSSKRVERRGPWRGGVRADDEEEGALMRGWEPGADLDEPGARGVGWSASGMRRRLRKKVRTSWTVEVSWVFIFGWRERGSATRATITWIIRSEEWLECSCCMLREEGLTATGSGLMKRALMPLMCSSWRAGWMDVGSRGMVRKVRTFTVDGRCEKIQKELCMRGQLSS